MTGLDEPDYSNFDWNWDEGLKGADTAPRTVGWCCRCRAAMVTREIGGKPRRVCPVCEYVHFVEPKVAVGVCLIEGGRLLLVKRRFEPAKGKWSLPAGYLDYGEDPRRHAAIEVMEETGMEVRVGPLLDVIFNPPAQGGASIFILYDGSLVGGRLRPGDDADEADFFAPDELPPLAFESTLRAITRLHEVARATAASGRGGRPPARTRM